MSPSARRVLCIPQRGQIRHEVEGLRAEIPARGKSGGGARHGVRRVRRRLCPLRLRDQHGQSQGSDEPAQKVYCEAVTCRKRVKPATQAQAKMLVAWQLTKLCRICDKVLSCIFTANRKVNSTVAASPTSFCPPRHSGFLFLDFTGNANGHREELLLASVEDVAVGEGGVSSSRAWVRLTSAGIVTNAA